MRFFKCLVPVFGLSNFFNGNQNGPVKPPTTINTSKKQQISSRISSPSAFLSSLKVISGGMKGTAVLDLNNVAIVDSLVRNDAKTEQFSNYLIKNYLDIMHKFLCANQTFSYNNFLNVAFIDFATENRAEARNMLENMIIPEYPLLKNEATTSLLLFEEKVIKDSNICGFMDEIIWEVFQAEILKVSDSNSFKDLLWKTRQCIKITDQAFRYHYAFLLNVPFDDFKSIDKSSITEFSNFQDYIGKLASVVYEFLPIETAKLYLGMVLPNVFDALSELANYEEVIKAYVFYQKAPIKNSSLKGRIIHFLNISGKEDFGSLAPIQQKTLLLLNEYSNEHNHKTFTQFAFRNFLFTLDLDLDNQLAYWKCWTVSLMIRFSALYPEEFVQLGFPLNVDIIFGEEFGIEKEDIEFVTQHGFLEVMHLAFKDSKSVKADSQSPRRSLQLNHKSKTMEITLGTPSFDIVGLDTKISRDFRAFLQPEIDGADSFDFTEMETFASVINSAAVLGRFTALRLLLQMVQSIPDAHYAEAVATCISKDQAELAQHILKSSKIVHITDIESALRQAVLLGRFKVFRSIFEKYMNFNVQIVSELVSLAASRGDFSVIEYFWCDRPELIEGSADSSKIIISAFESAVKHNQLPIMEYFLPNILEIDTYDRVKPMLISLEAGHDSMCLILIQNLKIQATQSLPVLGEAVNTDRIKIVETILILYPVLQSNIGNVLIIAANSQSFKTFKHIIEKYPEIDKKFINDAFIIATKLNSIIFIDVLFVHKYDDIDRMTLLESSEITKLNGNFILLNMIQEYLFAGFKKSKSKKN